MDGGQQWVAFAALLTTPHEDTRAEPPELPSAAGDGGKKGVLSEGQDSGGLRARCPLL